MATPEKKVKDQICRLVKEHHGGYEVKTVMQGMGHNGTPDILACVYGTFFGIEAKAGYGKPTKLQQNRLRRIEQAGGIAVVVNERNMDDFANLLNCCQVLSHSMPHLALQVSVASSLTDMFSNDEEPSE